MSTKAFDLAVIGAGWGGYSAAIRAAQLGGKVALVEKDRIGGVCLNRGCIPTKALLESVRVLETTNRSSEYGLSASVSPVDFASIRAKANDIVERLANVMTHIVQSRDIKMIKGTAAPISPGVVEVRENAGTKERIRCKNIVIATGSRPIEPTPDIEGEVINTDEALQLERIPKDLIIIEGGWMGVEFACIFSELGTDVTIVEPSTHILPNDDGEVAVKLQRLLQRKGVNVVTKVKVFRVSEENGKKLVVISTNKGEKKLHAEKVLITTRRPNTDDLHLENINIKLSDGEIVTDKRMKTNIKGIYAVGDVTGSTLAHLALAEGIVAGENVMGKDSTMDYGVVPRCIYTIPEVASVGLTEEQAREQNYDVEIGKSFFVGNGRALTLRKTEGFAKIVADAKYGEILGVHIIGPRATDLISMAATGMKLEATVDDFADTIQAHPTLAEVIKDAANDIRTKRRA